MSADGPRRRGGRQPPGLCETVGISWRNLSNLKIFPTGGEPNEVSVRERAVPSHFASG
ncbi:MAG: hypothetical protein LBQ54_00975 [Planctomycetaceae bacterium]|nr:hypothetical protein [Planctomycetaceae bacterium]